MRDPEFTLTRAGFSLLYDAHFINPLNTLPILETRASKNSEGTADNSNGTAM